MWNKLLFVVVDAIKAFLVHTNYAERSIENASIWKRSWK